MATRATIKFFDERGVVLSLYSQYDGYEEGVGYQLMQLFEKYEIVNGLTYGSNKPVANGIGDLALMYVVEVKDEAGSVYATNEGDSQEYDYEIHGRFNKEIGRDEIHKITVTNYGELLFEGNEQEYKKHILRLIK